MRLILFRLQKTEIFKQGVNEILIFLMKNPSKQMAKGFQSICIFIALKVTPNAFFFYFSGKKIKFFQEKIVYYS